MRAVRSAFAARPPVCQSQEPDSVAVVTFSSTVMCEKSFRS